MAPKRLSETEKQEIADRYRQPDESTATLSRAFGVSTSTIGRLLKTSFSAEEYDVLVQQKRLIGRGGAARSNSTDQAPKVEIEKVDPVSTSDSSPAIVSVSPSDHGETQKAAPKLRSRTRSRSRSRTSASSTNPAVPTRTSDDSDAQLGLSLEHENDVQDTSSSLNANSGASQEKTSVKREPGSRRRRRSSVQKISSQDAPQETGAVNSPKVIDHVAAEADDRDEREQTDPPTRSRKRRSRRVVVSSVEQDTVSDTPQPQQGDAFPKASVLVEDFSNHADEPSQSKPVIEKQALTTPVRMSSLASPPLSEATLPKTCYLVVDRLSELISRPLQEFEELGEIPQGENQEQTLPIFDNHRVARRFANRSQRVMKIPDSRVLQKTEAHLQAKGITRVLIDGKVYSLS
jgi:transposase-like protein